MMVIKLKEELVSTLAKYNLVKGIGQKLWKGSSS